MSDRVTCNISAGVADVRLARPDRRNALDLAMFDALVETGEALKAEASVRAVVLSGEGASFCAGLDLSNFETGPDRPRGVMQRIMAVADGAITHHAQQSCWVWQELAVPVIAAVHGHALGGGCQLALCADIRVVHPETQLSIMEIRWGLAPDMTATQLLPGLVGIDVAKELTFTGRIVTGREAVELGLCTRLSDSPRDDALALAAEIAAKNPNAIRAAKHLLNLAGTVSIAEGFAEERRVAHQLIGSPNQSEAVAAGMAKRDPVFRDPD